MAVADSAVELRKVLSSLAYGPQLLYDAQSHGFHPQRLGADKAYDARACVAAIRQEHVTPHVAQNTNGRRSAIDGRTTRLLATPPASLRQ